ncbi:MAG: glycosyltransferase family 2 protein [Candidatus Methanomethyliaceae archaeon]
MIPSVSVIIPAYNAEVSIIHALNSVLCQSIGDIEVIVINDCSEDRTLELLMTVKDPRLRILNNIQNVGPAASRNKGIDVAIGQYIAFLDADDALHPQYIEYLLNCTAGLGPKSVLASDIWICKSKPDGSMSPLYRKFSRSRLCATGFTVNPITLAALIDHHIDIKPFMQRQALLEDNVRFWDSARGEEWLPFLVELLLKGWQFFLVNEGLYYYGVHKSNLSRSYRMIVREQVSIDRLIQECALDAITLEALKRYRAFLRARAPWVALRCGRFKEFIQGLEGCPAAIWFPIHKLVVLRYGFCLRKNRACGE